MAKLILFGPNGPEDFELSNELTIGRRSTNTLRLLEEFVSRDHIKITKNDTGFLLEDVSSNSGVGVIVNNVKLKGVEGKNPQHKLRHNDVILINDIQLAFDDPSSDPDAMPTMVPMAIREKLKQYEIAKMVKQPTPPIHVVSGNPQRQAYDSTPSPASMYGKAPPTPLPAKKIQIPEAKAKTSSDIEGHAVSMVVGSHRSRISFKSSAAAQNAANAPVAPSYSADDNQDSVGKTISGIVPPRHFEKPAVSADARSAINRHLSIAVIILSALSLGALAGIIWMFSSAENRQKVMLLFGGKNIVEEVNTALAAGKVEAADGLLKENQDRLSLDERAKLKNSIAKVKRSQVLAKVREKVKENKFDEAQRWVQAELSTRGREVKDEFNAYADFTSSALNAMKFVENSQGADKCIDLIRLQDIEANVHDALDEFARNQQKVNDYKASASDKNSNAQIEPISLMSSPDLQRLKDVCLQLNKTAEERIALIRSADKVWNEVMSAQKAGAWEKEKAGLEATAKFPQEIAERFTKGQRIALVVPNAQHFVAGMKAIAEKQLKVATEEFALVSKDDAHRAAADKALIDVAKLLKFDEVVATYAEGNASDAIAKLNSMTNDPEAVEFRAHIEKVAAGWEALRAAKESRVSEKIIQQATAVLGMMDARDTWFKKQASTTLSEVKRNGSVLRFAQLRKLFEERKYQTLKPLLEAFMAEVERPASQDLYDDAAKIKAKIVDTILESTTSAFAFASDAWKKYSEERLSALDVSSGDEVHAAKFNRQAAVLSEIWPKLKEANQLADSAKAELRAPIKALYEQFVAEIVRHSEKLESARKIGLVTERADYVKLAEDRMLMLPAVPNNRWYDAVKANRK